MWAESECLYVARGSKGLLKVGKTRNVLLRQRQLAADFKVMGEVLVRFDSTEPLYHGSPEARLIRSVEAQGLSLIRGREWFRGGDFDGILQLAHKLQFEEYQNQKKKHEEAREKEQNNKAKRDAAKVKRFIETAKELLPMLKNGTLLQKFPELKEYL